MFKYGHDLSFLATRKRIREVDLVVVDLRERINPGCRETPRRAAKVKAISELLERLPRADYIVLQDNKIEDYTFLDGRLSEPRRISFTGENQRERYAWIRTTFKCSGNEEK